jgi:hypothetical protein
MMSKRIRVNFDTINGDNWEKLDVGDFGDSLTKFSSESPNFVKKYYEKCDVG